MAQFFAETLLPQHHIPQWKGKVSNRVIVQKMKHKRMPGTLHIHHSGLLEVTDRVLQAKLWKHQIFKSRQIGTPLVGCVTQIHYESFGSHTAVSVSVMRARASQATALFLHVFISCHFFNRQRINRILCSCGMCGAVT